MMLNASTLLTSNTCIVQHIGLIQGMQLLHTFQVDIYVSVCACMLHICITHAVVLHTYYTHIALILCTYYAQIVHRLHTYFTHIPHVFTHIATHITHIPHTARHTWHTYDTHVPNILHTWCTGGGGPNRCTWGKETRKRSIYTESIVAAGVQSNV